MRISNITQPVVNRSVNTQNNIQQPKLTPSTNAWIDAISSSLKNSSIQEVSRISQPAYEVNISQEAKNSKYWNDESITFPLANTNVQSYTKDLQLVYKSNY